MTGSSGHDDVLVVGTGLIGTSIGLAATAAGRRVWLADHEGDRARFAASLGAGTAVEDAGVAGEGSSLPVGLVVVAVPPRAVGSACIEALRSHVDAVVTHVCSVQSQPEREIEAAGVGLLRFAGSHPIAGREQSGPSAADAELFVDRPWVVCPTVESADGTIDAIVALARECGARPVLLRADEHDQVMARLSHAPQLVASALAAAIGTMDPAAAQLAGTGLRDTTRLADSDPRMWGQIAAANAPALAASVRAVAEPLLALAERLESGRDGDLAVEDLLRRGRAARALLPGKHGRRPVSLATVHCVVPDQPGALARLLSDIAADGVNVEDLRVDHAPGQPVGTAELAVLPADRAALLHSLRVRGWAATAGADEAL